MHISGLWKTIQEGEHFSENTRGRKSSIVEALFGLTLLSVFMLTVSACRADETVTIGSRTWSVETATTPEERYQGLSGGTE